MGEDLVLIGYRFKVGPPLHLPQTQNRVHRSSTSIFLWTMWLDSSLIVLWHIALDAKRCLMAHFLSLFHSGVAREVFECTNHTIIEVPLRLTTNVSHLRLVVHIFHTWITSRLVSQFLVVLASKIYNLIQVSIPESSYYHSFNLRRYILVSRRLASLRCSDFNLQIQLDPSTPGTIHWYWRQVSNLVCVFIKHPPLMLFNNWRLEKLCSAMIYEENSWQPIAQFKYIKWIQGTCFRSLSSLYVLNFMRHFDVLN